MSCSSRSPNCAYCTLPMQPCPADLPGSFAMQPWPASMPGSLAQQPCTAVLPGSLAEILKSIRPSRKGCYDLALTCLLNKAVGEPSTAARQPCAHAVCYSATATGQQQPHACTQVSCHYCTALVYSLRNYRTTALRKYYMLRYNTIRQLLI
jgi:hypothetical protein